MMASVVVAGMRASGDGYQNADVTIRTLREHGVADIVDLGRKLPPDAHLWKLVRAGTGWGSRLRLAWMLFAGNLISATRALPAAWRAGAIVYLPYPAIPMLLILRCVPLRWRPRCVADAFISIWDSTFNDRATGASSGLASTLVKAIESFALRAAWRVIVDTEANRDLLIETMGLSRGAVISLPLGTVAMHRADRGSCAGGPMRVLFVGTFIPLHGIETIIEAIKMLSSHPGIVFELVGDGQEAARLAAASEWAGADNVTWTRDWLSMPRIAAKIAEADVCLGVFGGAAKASRVLPFKVYHALSAGKVVVTQAAMSLPEGLPPLPCVPVCEVSTPQAARALADALCALEADLERRKALGHEAARYFDTYLSSGALAARWTALLADDTRGAGACGDSKPWRRDRSASTGCRWAGRVTAGTPSVHLP